MLHREIHACQKVRLGDGRERCIRCPRHVDDDVRKPPQQLLDMLGDTQVERVLLKAIAHGSDVETTVASVDDNNEGVSTLG